MSFYPVHSSFHARDDFQLHACDDLEIIDEQINVGDIDRDSLSHRIKDNTPQLTQHKYDDEEHKQQDAPNLTSSSLTSHLTSPSPQHLPLPHLSSAFPFHSPFHAHKHNKSSSSICSLPASPTDHSHSHDVSNEHGGRGGGGGGNSRRVSRTADPATLFLLHRIMKGDVFTLYTASHTSVDSFDATPVFLFYDAHGRLGSLYWTTQRKRGGGGAHSTTIHEDDDASSSSSSSTSSSSTLTANRFVRHMSPTHCIPIHTLTYVGHGKPAALLPSLTTSPLSSACFLTLESSTHTLHLSHHEPSVVRQWVACLRDIFIQNGHDVRDADSSTGDATDSPRKAGAGGGKGAAGLLGLFADPTDGSDDSSDDSGSGSGSGNGSGSGGSGGGGGGSVLGSDMGRKRSSLSLSEKSVDCDLLDKGKQRKESMALCQCVIC